jgi:cob(I)alamin adenosyltransferase
MKIYTKTGDDGTTGLFGGGRVSKSNHRVEAYGTVDELNAVLGMARSSNTDDLEMHEILGKLQETLFVLGADLATPEGKGGESAMRLATHEASGLEEIIDKCQGQLEPLKNFVLPGGCPQAAQLHLARTVCRRAERQVVSMLESEIPLNAEILIYLNRLSDLLFVLGRWANSRADQPETLWQPRNN